MGNLIYPLVAALLNSWIIGYLGYGAGKTIHIFLAIAIIVILNRVFHESGLLKNWKVSHPKGVNHVRHIRKSVSTALNITRTFV